MMKFIQQQHLLSLVYDFTQAPMLNHMAKFMFLTTNGQSHTFLRGFSYICSIYNSIIAYVNPNGINITVIDPFKDKVEIKGSIEVLNPSDEFYYDRLKNLNGYAYRIVAYNLIGEVYIDRNDRIIGKFLPFTQMLAEKQNASINVHALTNTDLRHLTKLFLSIILKRQIDLSINKVVKSKNGKKLLIYEENSFCAMIPLPPKVTFYRTTLIEPFDNATWIFFAITVTACVLVWRLFKGRGAVESHWRLMFGMFALSLGQGVNFSRNNRTVLTIMLQFIVAMIYIICNGYSGVLTSFMIQPDEIHMPIKTFDQVFESDYNISVTSEFNWVMKDDPKYQAAKMRISMHTSGLWDFKQLSADKYVIQWSCEQIDYYMNHYNSQFAASNYYYVLPDRILTQYHELEGGFLNPFMDKFQYYYDRAFEAGLPQIWKVLFELKLPKLLKGSKDEKVEDNVLHFDEILPLFIILPIGFGIAFIVLLIEIFYHDFCHKISLNSCRQRMRKGIHKMARKSKKERRGRLRFIQVRPINPDVV